MEENKNKKRYKIINIKKLEDDPNLLICIEGIVIDIAYGLILLTAGVLERLDNKPFTCFIYKTIMLLCFINLIKNSIYTLNRLKSEYYQDIEDNNIEDEKVYTLENK